MIFLKYYLLPSIFSSMLFIFCNISNSEGKIRGHAFVSYTA